MHPANALGQCVPPSLWFGSPIFTQRVCPALSRYQALRFYLDVATEGSGSHSVPALEGAAEGISTRKPDRRSDLRDAVAGGGQAASRFVETNPFHKTGRSCFEKTLKQ